MYFCLFISIESKTKYMQNSTTCARTNHGKTVFLFVYIQTNYIISLLTIYIKKTPSGKHCLTMHTHAKHVLGNAYSNKRYGNV